jgi:hypothetical protein
MDKDGQSSRGSYPEFMLYLHQPLFRYQSYVIGITAHIRLQFRKMNVRIGSDGFRMGTLKRKRNMMRGG